MLEWIRFKFILVDLESKGKSCFAILIGLTANQLNYLEEDQFIEFEISRTGNIDVPIAVELEYSGTAEYGIDFSRGNGFVIMSSMETTFIDSIQIIQDLVQESTESLLMTAIENDCVFYLGFFINSEYSTL